MGRIYLSPPRLTGEESALLQQTLDSGWVAPLGPQVDAFEAEFAAVVQVPHCAALASGTAAIHLALRLLGVGPDDEVLCPTLTFVASANPVLYQGARPVFLDADPATWNLDPNLLAEELRRRARRNRLPAAVISVDLYGQCADYDPIVELCDEFAVPLIEDAAEALGASYRGRPAGGFGRFAAFSFNGNKIITTSSGGMLVSSDGEAIARARNLAAQARRPAPHYQHAEMGYNYRLSNLLAAVGRAQLRTLDERVAGRRRVFATYRQALGHVPGIDFMPEAPYGRATRWLTCLTLDPERCGADRETVRLALEAEDIESRPLWKPMHLQPLFAAREVRGGAVAERLFATGLCLPSGHDLSGDDLDRIVAVVLSSCGARR